MKAKYLMANKYAFASCRKYILTAALVVTFGAFPALAQEETNTEPMPVLDVVDILPVKTLTGEGAIPAESESTHPTINLTPDKSELIRLDRDAGTIIVGNPSHVSVIADSSQTLVIVPRIPGATYFTVLDHKGDVIMQRHIIVASPKENYIRVRRSCSGDEKGCQNTSIFYCPDMCHEIMISGEDEEASGGSSGGSSNSDDGGGSEDAEAVDE